MRDWHAGNAHLASVMPTGNKVRPRRHATGSLHAERASEFSTLRLFARLNFGPKTKRDRQGMAAALLERRDPGSRCWEGEGATGR